MSKTLVVMVHGINVESAKWWGSTIEKLNEDSELADKGFHFIPYEYKTNLFENIWNKLKNFVGLGYTLSELSNIGRNLISIMNAIEELDEYDNIIMFGHSMGGFVVSNALIYANETQPLSYIRKKISHSIFCGTPLGGSNLANRSRWTRLITFLLRYPSLHSKTLRTDNCTREVMAHRMKSFIEFNGVRKTNLSFVVIGDDEVVTTDQERFGIFYNQLAGLHTPTILGGHSKSVQNLGLETNSLGNFSIIKEHFLFCYNSDICKQNRARYEERLVLRTSWLNSQNILERKQKEYHDVLINEIIKNHKRILSSANEQQLNDINTFIDLDIFYRKTFLKNQKVILDLNREMMVVDGNRDTIVELSTGFSQPSTFATQNFIQNELIKKFKVNCCTGQDRFNEYSINIKIIDRTNGERQLVPVNKEDISYKIYSQNDIVGLKTIVNLGRYNIGDKVDIFSSYTLPTTLWEEGVDDYDDIKLPANALKATIVLQEELYETSAPSLAIRVLANNQANIDINRTSTIYYKTHTATKMYESVESVSQPFEVRIGKI